MKWFSEKEFACKCGCGFNFMEESFLGKLDYAREKANVVFMVESGCRCPQHNYDVGGVEDSEHVTGQGVDIVCTSSFARWRIVHGAMAAGIRRIGIGSNYVHLGDDLSKPQPRIWHYYKEGK